QQAFQLLMLEHLDHLAQTSAQAISNIKFDKVVVWENGNGVNGNGSSNMSGFLQNLARTMPPMMQVLKDIGGVEIPEYLVRMAPEAPADEEARFAARTTPAPTAPEDSARTAPLPPKG